GPVGRSVAHHHHFVHFGTAPQDLQNLSDGPLLVIGGDDGSNPHTPDATSSNDRRARLTSDANRAAASWSGRRSSLPSERRRNSASPVSSERGPTVSRYGKPIRSASLNFTPGRS